MKHKTFVKDNPLAYLVVPLAFVLITVALVWCAGGAMLTPYKTMIGWFFDNTAAAQPQDLFEDAAAALDGQPVPGDAAQPATIALSSIAYPAKGDRYGRITVSGTTVDAPLYCGDTNQILNQGVGTYADDSRAGIPGEGKTVLLAGHNNTFFNDLQHVEVGSVVTIETHYGVYTYEVTETKVLDYQDSSAYDFSRTDENLILYTCYPFDAMGYTPDRYFVYGKYISGPVLDANS